MVGVQFLAVFVYVGVGLGAVCAAGGVFVSTFFPVVFFGSV
jgi:hypothetical protein